MDIGRVDAARSSIRGRVNAAKSRLAGEDLQRPSRRNDPKRPIREADIHWREWDVRFGPLTDISSVWKSEPYFVA